MFQYAFKEKNDIYQRYVAKKCIHYLIYYVYHNRALFVYEAIGPLIYSFIDNLICLDSPGKL